MAIAERFATYYYTVGWSLLNLGSVTSFSYFTVFGVERPSSSKETILKIFQVLPFP